LLGHPWALAVPTSGKLFLRSLVLGESDQCRDLARTSGRRRSAASGAS